VHAEHEPLCNQPASSSEAVADSDSVYSVCCSDVVNDADAPDIVHVDYEMPVVTGRGMTKHACHSHFFLIYSLIVCAKSGLVKKVS